MPAFVLAADALEHLVTLLQEAYEINPEPKKLSEAFIFRHSRFVSEIGRDMSLLFSYGQYAAASIAVRSMLESCFCVAAALKIETFAAERVIGEANETIRRLKFIWKGDERESVQDAIDSYEALIEKIRKENPSAIDRKWSIYEIARAGLPEGFYTLYFVHCGATHATVGGMISHEYESTVGTILETSITAMISTAATLAQALGTKTPQASIDTCEKLLDRLSEMSTSGEFKKLNAKKENTPREW